MPQDDSKSKQRWQSPCEQRSKPRLTLRQMRNRRAKTALTNFAPDLSVFVFTLDILSSVSVDHVWEAGIGSPNLLKDLPPQDMCLFCLMY